MRGRKTGLRVVLTAEEHDQLAASFAPRRPRWAWPDGVVRSSKSPMGSRWSMSPGWST